MGELSKIRDKVIVLTGATSGIGLVTARMAAKHGAKLMLVSRNSEALEKLTAEIQSQGEEAAYSVADVGIEEDHLRILQNAVQALGPVDVWINNAGVTMFGDIEETSIEDARRLFDSNFWGVAYGCRTAANHMKERGGILINVGSAAADRIIPLQAYYSASKAAVQAFTSSMRLELQTQKYPIEITHIAPSAIDTPIAKSAKSYLDVEPRIPPPQYDPEVVAKAILACAVKPRYQVVIGFPGQFVGHLEKWMPSLLDKFMRKIFYDWTKTDEAPNSTENLYHSGSKLIERGNQSSFVRKRSYYTEMRLNPLKSTALIGGVVFLGLFMKHKLSRPTLIRTNRQSRIK